MKLVRKTRWSWVGLVVLAACAARAGALRADGAPNIPFPHASEPVGASEGVFNYQFDRGTLGFADLVTLETGEKKIGKAMEWANQVLVYRARSARPDVFPTEAVKTIEFRRIARHRDVPNECDLTVALVERASGAGGEAQVVIRVLNAGAAESREAPLRVELDGRRVFASKVPALAPGEQTAIEAAFAADEKARLLTVSLDPDGHEPEVARWNNRFTECWSARPVTIRVSRRTYEAFRTQRNLVDSYCFEDWAQYQIRCMNGLFRASTYLTAPKGIVPRLRCGRIDIVEDRQAPATDGEGLMLRYLDSEAPAPLRVDWKALKALGLQLGLLDLSLTDTTAAQCCAVDRRGLYAQLQHRFAFGRTLMHAPGGFALSELDAAWLNEPARSRGDAGASRLYRLPKTIAVAVRSKTGQPLRDVQIDVFQLQSRGEMAGRVAGVGKGDPLYSAPTGVGGYFALLPREDAAEDTAAAPGHRPNPFGVIEPDGRNGLLLLKFRSGEAEEFRFVTLFECLLAYVHGDHDEFVIEVPTSLGDPDAPKAPLSTAMHMDDREKVTDPMYATWRWPPDTPARAVDEYRVYRRWGLGGLATSPWELVDTVRRGAGRWNLRSDFSLGDVPDGVQDVSYAVSAVGPTGGEGGLSAPGYLALGTDSLKFALDGESGFTTLTRRGEMLRWNGEIATHPFGIRNFVAPGYGPAMAGVAITSDRRVVVTDPVNHVLAFYDDKGELEEVFPQRPMWPGYASDQPGEFNEPWDVAVDDAGRLYVADFGNDRVQIIDPQLEYAGEVLAPGGFDGPHAVAYSNHHLCVTDRGGHRCRIWSIDGDTLTFQRELPPLWGADRALVSRSGRIYLTAQMGPDEPGGVFIFAPDGSAAKFVQTVFEIEMGKVYAPRGFYLYTNQLAEDYGYCVNQYPFDIRRILLQ